MSSFFTTINHRIYGEKNQFFIEPTDLFKNSCTKLKLLLLREVKTVNYLHVNYRLLTFVSYCIELQL